MPLNEQFQVSNETREDRFPKIFGMVKKKCPKPKKILSFGCSRGLECFTLNQYFPESEIIGYDLNKWAISSAVTDRDLRKITKVQFTSDLKGRGKFDVIFALMVFFSIESPIPEPTFNRSVKELAAKVAPGGLIAFHNLEFEFKNSGFKVVRKWKHENNRNPGRNYYGGIYRRKISLFEKIKMKLIGS